MRWYLRTILIMFTVAAAFTSIAGVIIIDNRLDRVEHHMCAWQFFEDGSVREIKDDTTRYACLNSRRGRR